MIFLIIFVGMILRSISLNQSFWLDEATTALVAKMSVSEMFSKFLPSDFHPPLYYLFMKFWTGVFGYSEISLRVPSLIFGLGTIYLCYVIGKKLFDKNVGLISAALIAVSGLAIYYSQEARMYELVALLVSCLVYSYINRKWYLFSIILLLVGMTDYVALLVFPVFIIIDFKNWRKLFLSLVPLSIGYIIWSPIFVKQILNGLSVKGSSWWNILGTPTFKNLALIPIKFMFGRISFDNKIFYFTILAVALCFFGFLLYKSLKSSKILWVWLVFPILIGFIGSFIIPTLTYFRYLFCLPAFYLLIAYGIRKTGKLFLPLTVVLIVFNLCVSGYYLLNSKFHRENWRGLVNYIESKKDKNSITVFPANSNMEAYFYYAPNAKITGQTGIGATYHQVWFVDYLSSIFDPDGATKSKITDLGYKKQGEYSFNGIGSVYLYENSN